MVDFSPSQYTFAGILKAFPQGLGLQSVQVLLCHTSAAMPLLPLSRTLEDP